MATTLASTMVTVVVLVGVLVVLGIALLVVGVRLVRATGPTRRRSGHSR